MPPISPSNFTSISARLEANNCAAKRPSLPASAMYGLICLYSTSESEGRLTAFCAMPCSR